MLGVVGYVGYRGQLAELMAKLDEVKKTADDAKLAIVQARDKQNEIEKLNIGPRLDHMGSTIDTRLNTTSERVNAASQALAFTQLAQQQISLGDFESAAESLESACKLDPDNYVARYFLGDVLVRLERLDQGVIYLQEAIQGRDFPAAHVAYAYALRLRGDIEKENKRPYQKIYAEAAYILETEKDKHKRLLDISGESAYGALASLYRREGQLQNALDVYKLAHEVTPYNSYPINNMAILSYLLGDRDKALEYFGLSRKRATQKLTLNALDFWSRFDLITADVALETDAKEIFDELEAAIDILDIGAVKPLEKLLSGINELITISNGPKLDEQVGQRIQQEIDRRLKIAAP